MSDIKVEDLDELVSKIERMRHMHDEVKAEASALGNELKALEEKAVGYLKELDRTSFQTKWGTIGFSRIWSVATPKTDKDRQAFFQWMKDKGIYDDYIGVNSQALNKLYRTEMEAAKERGDLMDFQIPGISEPTLFERFSFRKAKE